MKRLIPIIAFLFILKASSQTLYFPPTSGTTWDTLSPSTLGWCQPRIDSLYTYLEAKESKAFIILKDGKIVLEKYFGTFTQDSAWYWASCGKSLTATLVGIAQQEGLMDINAPASDYLGTGWTSATINQEDSIKIWNLLTMTSGLDDTPPLPCDNTDTATACLQYLVDAGTRWAYHTGPYRRLEEAVSNASGVTYNSFTNTRMEDPTGMSGAWSGGVYFSRARDMARFGLLTLNKGIWANDTILNDTAYFYAMTHTSQSFNLSYGYLWWLNGQSSCMAPGLQTVFPNEIIANAPDDMIAALGKNDQKIYVVPSQNMVVVRMGNAAYTSELALSSFDNELWAYIDSLSCTIGIDETEQSSNTISIYPNPSNGQFEVNAEQEITFIEILNAVGQQVCQLQPASKKAEINLAKCPPGVYFVKLNSGNRNLIRKIIIQ